LEIVHALLPYVREEKPVRAFASYEGEEKSKKTGYDRPFSGLNWPNIDQ
jgi:hypothetical protein